MSGSVQMLAEHGSLVGNDGRLLEIVLRESDRLNKLITDFLVYARPPLPQKVSIELKTMIEDMRLLLLADSRFDNIEIVIKIPPDVVILADYHQISQVVMNLLHNSAEAMPEGGLIIIESKLIQRSADGLLKSPAVLVTFTDNGKGIDSESAKHIFEPFWTSKTNGTGLGLAIIYRIIEAHGGSVKVESPSTGGCRFSIMFPV
jgi:two-component system sensor histidine kinase PilS (NtrC family)